MTEPPDRTDLDQIFRVLLPRAREALVAADGRLAPFGAALDPQGQLHAALAVPAADSLQPNVVLDRMVDDFRRQAAEGKVKACGVVYDAQVEGPAGSADAIAVWLEHQGGESAVIYLPYSRSASGTFEFGSLIPAGGPRRVFV